MLLAGLSACAVSPPPSAPPIAPGPPIAPLPERPALRVGAPPGCRMVPAASLPLLPFDADKPVVNVSLDGHRLRMQVDTGAETSVLTIAGAAALGLAPGPMRQKVEGLGGTAGYGTVRLDRIAFGGQTVRGHDLPVMRLQGPGDLGGLIGADLLAPYQVELDVPSRRLTLFRADGCAAPGPSWPSVALAWTTAHTLPIVAADLDGQTVMALLDTGATASAVDARQVNADLRGDRQIQSYGAGGMSIAGRVHRFGILTLGGVSVSGPSLRVVALDRSIGVGLLIGMDVLASRRIWLDYARRRVFIEGR